MRYIKLWVFTVFSSIAAILFWSLFDQSKTIHQSEKWALPIVPHPQEIRLKNKEQSFIIKPSTRILVSGLTLKNRAEVEVLNSALNKHFIQPLEVGFNAEDFHDSIIVGELNSGNSGVDSLVSRSGLIFTESYPGSEGYFLDINPDYVLIAGQDSSGTFYGVQSLLQLIYRENDQLKIRPATIIDYPDMSLRSAFYGFYLNTLEDDALIERAYVDFNKIGQFKFNMIDLALHHYGHLEMEVPSHPEEKLWQRFARLHDTAQRYNLRPRVGGWAKWVNTKSQWGVDLTTLEGIRTSQMIQLNGTNSYDLEISSGKIAPNVMHEPGTGRQWNQEPFVVMDESGSEVFKEGRDYRVNFGEIHAEAYQKFYNTRQTNLEVLFSEVHSGEGEPAGYPLRWGETFNAPTTIRRLRGGQIEDGQIVKVDFSYIGPDPWSILKVRYCRSDRRLHTDGPENYIWRWCNDPARFLGADDFSLDVDETRVFAWDKRCLDSGKTRSQTWVDDILYYYKTIRSTNPGARISMWSDMVDPEHHAGLYGTQGTASLMVDAGMTDVIMIPWKSSIAAESVRFFADKGFPIMPSCQNITKEGYSDAPKWASLLREFYSDKNLPFGMMYCSWEYKFDTDLAWEQLATVADHAWSSAPYIIHTPVRRAPAETEIEIVAKIEGDKFVFDDKKVRLGPLAVKRAFLYYKKSRSDSSYTRTVMIKTGTQFSAIIPGAPREVKTIEYYIQVSNETHISYSPKLAQEKPFEIIITMN